MAVITISRQYGSGADEIAARVCDKLGYRFFDKRVIAGMASEFGLTASNVVDFSEDRYKVRGFLDRLRGPRVVAQVRSWREDLSGRRVPTVEQLDEEQAIRLVRSAIRAAYDDDSIVILGRGGQCVLKDQPGVLHVRVEAAVEARARRIQAQASISEDAALKLVNERDRAGADYVRNFYDVDWSDSAHYHLIINTAKWGTETAAQLIVSAVNALPAA